MPTDYYFATPIHVQDLEVNSEFNADLLHHIFAWQRADNEGIVRSNFHLAGAWHSQLDMHNRHEFEPIRNLILQRATTLFNSLHYDPTYEPVIDSMWANINPRHAHNRSHLHPDTLWSGVYYVQAPPNCGRISFSDPRLQARVISPRYRQSHDLPLHCWPEIYFEAVAGRLILFPAWLVHEVEPNLTAVPGQGGYRVSISFNIFQHSLTTDN